MWSTLLTCTCRAGVTHSWQEHILPDQITSQIRTPHFGQFSFRSLSSLSGSQAGGSMNSELHPLPCNTFANRPVRHFWQR